jgi:hypothetical protein
MRFQMGNTFKEPVSPEELWMMLTSRRNIKSLDMSALPIYSKDLPVGTLCRWMDSNFIVEVLPSSDDGAIRCKFYVNVSHNKDDS